MKFKLDLDSDSENNRYGYDGSGSAEIETSSTEDWVEISLQNPERCIRMKKSELRYALSFFGTEQTL
jgi:hypothetical protein